MSIQTPAAKASKVKNRTMRVLSFFGRDLTARIRISQGSKVNPEVTVYDVALKPIDPAFGWMLAVYTKVETNAKNQEMRSDEYNLAISVDQVATSCECAGWLSHGHCKHSDSLPMVLRHC